MNKSFRNFSKLALGATLVTSVLMIMSPTDSKIASQTDASEKMDSYLNFDAPETQYIEFHEDTLIDNPIERANFVVLETPFTTGGNYWHQPGGYKYFHMNVVNRGNQPLNVTIIEDGVSGFLGAVPVNSSRTWVSPQLRLPANGKNFYLAYSTKTGKVSGTVKVHVSDVPLL